MTTGMHYFMVTAQEKSISRAAKRLYVSQQSLSEQLKRLEALYGTQLFVRRPRFSLTASGEALLQTLKQIQVLEDSLSAQLQEIQQKGAGTLRIGIHSARARTFLPGVIGRYHRMFPSVQLDFIHADTSEFEQQLLAGQLDLFFGIDTQPLPEFQSIYLGSEPIYVVASEKLIRQKLGPQWDGTLHAADLEQLPAIFSPPVSHLQREIDRFLKHSGITPKHIITISDYELQMMIAAQGIAICFCPEQFLIKLDRLNTQGNPHKLCSFPLDGFSYATRHEIVYHKMGYHPPFFQAFLSIFMEEYTRQAGHIHSQVSAQ